MRRTGIGLIDVSSCRYVTLKAGAYASPEIPVSAGDVIFGNMTRTGTAAYDVGASFVVMSMLMLLMNCMVRLMVCGCREFPWCSVHSCVLGQVHHCEA